LPDIRPIKESRSLTGTSYLADLMDDEEPQLEFPKLTSSQRQFGVNPGYQAFNDPKIRIMAPYNQDFLEDNGLNMPYSKNLANLL